MSKVMVVEDDDSIRELLAMTLQDDGHDVLTARNGAEALTTLEKRDVDCILLDLCMPVLDGVGFSAIYRSWGRHTPIVILTAAHEAVSAAAQIEADGYLRKPFELDDLSDIVRMQVRGN